MADRKQGRILNEQGEFIQGAHAERPIPVAEAERPVASAETADVQRQLAAWKKREATSGKEVAVRRQQPPVVINSDGSSVTEEQRRRGMALGTNDRPTQTIYGRPMPTANGRTAGGHFRPEQPSRDTQSRRPAQANNMDPNSLIAWATNIDPKTDLPAWAKGLDPHNLPAWARGLNAKIFSNWANDMNPSKLPDWAADIDPSRAQNPRSISAQIERNRRQLAFLRSLALPFQRGTAQIATNELRTDREILGAEKADMLAINDGSNPNVGNEIALADGTDMKVGPGLVSERRAIRDDGELSTEIDAATVAMGAEIEARHLPSQSMTLKAMKSNLFDGVFARMKREGATMPQRSAYLSHLQTLLNDGNGVEYAAKLDGLTHDEFRNFEELHQAIREGASIDQQRQLAVDMHKQQQVDTGMVLGRSLDLTTSIGTAAITRMPNIS